jgi:hypothetical protein
MSKAKNVLQTVRLVTDDVKSLWRELIIMMDKNESKTSLGI